MINGYLSNVSVFRVAVEDEDIPHPTSRLSRSESLPGEWMMSVAKRPVILCVEDEPTLLELRKLQLEQGGYQVHTARSADEAFAIFSTANIDLLLTDYLLPHVNGVALGFLMKRSKPDLTVVVISGSAECPTDAPGIDLFLSKPMHTAEMLAAISALLPSAKRYGT
jgi:DNA-binding response OmpR family regulator